MTRKRFVKLLMSKGYSRNGAINIANHVPTSGITYKRMYIITTAFNNMCDGIIAAIPTVIEAAVSKISEVVYHIVYEMPQALSDALNTLEEGVAYDHTD